MKTRKTPLRKCVACGKNFEKKSLLRVVLCPDGKIELDETGRINGRGAYLCKDISCKKDNKAIKRLKDSLKVDMTSEIIEEIQNYFEKIKDMEVLNNEN
ncbi:MAG: YlxR family protein [Tissierellia bacterium]|nr:YlxR family protein [Tissierellia bacterium]